jgi:hypothetical protein
MVAAIKGGKKLDDFFNREICAKGAEKAQVKALPRCLSNMRRLSFEQMGRSLGSRYSRC